MTSYRNTVCSTLAVALVAGAIFYSGTAGANTGDAPRTVVAEPPLLWPHGVATNRSASVTLHYTIEPDGHVDNVKASDNTFNTNGADTPFMNAARTAIASRVYTPSDTAVTKQVVAKFHPAG